MIKTSVSFEGVFEKHISDIAKNTIIVSYDPVQNKTTHIYHPHSHTLDLDASKQLGELLRKYLVFYAYSEDEIIDKEESGGLSDLEHAARIALDRRIPTRKGATNGLYGEVFMDLLLYLRYDKLRKFCLRTVYRQKGDNQEIKGFDALHLIIDGDKKHLLLGQAKLGSRQYCLSSIAGDLKKADFLYTYDELCFVVDKTGYVTQEVKQELKKFNELFVSLEGESDDNKKAALKTFLLKNNYRLIVPCLIAYEQAEIYDDLDAKIAGEIQDIAAKLDSSDAAIDFCEYEIVFMVFPLKDINALRTAMGLNDEQS